jgi:hypothetical protein
LALVHASAVDCSVTGMRSVMPSGGGKPKAGLYRKIVMFASKSSRLVAGIVHDACVRWNGHSK